MGLRAALATALPLALAFLLGMPEIGWAGLTGLLVSLVDRGGSYRHRARLMGTVTLLGALVGALAAPAGGSPWVDAVLLLVGVTVLTFARCYGETAGALGGQLAVIFVASLGGHAVGVEEAAVRGGALLLGGGWAMVQALVLWPLRPYRPARLAVAQVYLGLAAASDVLARHTRAPAGPEAWADKSAHHALVRARIEEARATLGATRLGSPAESSRGEHLLVLLELSEPVFTVLLGLSLAMEVAAPEPHLHSTREQVARLCEAFAAMARWVERGLARERNEGRPRPLRLPWRGRAAEACESPPVRPQEGPPPASVEELLTRLREYAGVVHETAAGLLHGDPAPASGRRAAGAPGARTRSLLEPLREHLDPHSFVLRHALRAGLVAAAALLLTHAFGLGQAHWVVLAAIGILQPYSASTEERGLQRVAGTLLGAVLAAAIAARVASPLGLVVVIAVLTAVSVSLLPLNFGAFQVLLTPDYLLLATLHYGDWSVAGDRMLGVGLACVLALLGAWFLWPSPERRRFADAAAEALRADGDYLRQVAAHGSATEPAVGTAQRHFGIAMLEAEASFQRLLAEYHGPPQHLEPGMALLTYSRRLAASVAALAQERSLARDAGALRALAEEAGGTLDTLAESLRARRAPPPLPRLPRPRTEGDPVLGAIVERVPRQLDILHGAVARLAEGAHPAAA